MTDQGGMKTPTRGVGNLLPRNKNLLSNYLTNTEIESSSSVPAENETDSDDETQEGEEENLSLSENISANDEANTPTESYPAVSRNGASSTIEKVTQASGQSTPNIPHRPTGNKPIVVDEVPTAAKQARCNALAAKLTALRGYALENEATVREQAEAIRQLVATYSDDDIAWTVVYTFRFSEQYKGMKPGPKYASILLEVAPTAIQAAAPEVRAMLMQQSQPPATPPAQRAPQSAPVQPQQANSNPYSGAAQRERQRLAELAQQNNGRN